MMTGARIPRAHLAHQFEPVHALEPVVDDEAIDLGRVWRLQDIARFGIGADLVTFGTRIMGIRLGCCCMVSSDRGCVNSLTHDERHRTRTL